MSVTKVERKVSIHTTVFSSLKLTQTYTSVTVTYGDKAVVSFEGTYWSCTST